MWPLSLNSNYLLLRKKKKGNISCERCSRTCNSTEVRREREGQRTEN